MHYICTDLFHVFHILVGLFGEHTRLFLKGLDVQSFELKTWGEDMYIHVAH
jgi:hypothetical protein